MAAIKIIMIALESMVVCRNGMKQNGSKMAAHTFQLQVMS